MPSSRYTNEQLIEAVRQNFTWADVCRDIGLKQGTGGQTHIKDKAIKLGVDYSHFTGRTWDKETIHTLLLGKKFGKLNVVEFLGSKGSGNIWKCICDCGNEVECSTGHLQRGHRTSCGCANKKRKTGLDNPKWKGYGEISGRLWTEMKNGAINRNLEFKVTIEYAWELFLKQDRKCFLSGLDLIMMATCHDRAARTASLDRIDSNLGYTNDNIQWIHKRLNWLKNTFPQKELIEWANLISKQHPI